MNTLVIALGGNALQGQGQPATSENQLAVIQKTAQRIAPLMRDNRVLVVHGNGPQVGRLVLQNEHARDITPAMPFDVCGAMSQGLIGYHLQQGISQALREQGIPKASVTLLTQVVVDGADPAFQRPTKPIGPFYSREEAARIAADTGYTLKEDAGRGWRRVVASPNPVDIVELKAIRALLNAGFVPVCVGGGGIPVLKGGDDALCGTAAVIDKDLAAERLAEDLDADLLLILTAVDRVYLHYGKPQQQAVTALTADEADRLSLEGHFAPGSMGPKMEAAARFARSAKGRTALITSLDRAQDALSGTAGTRVTG